MKININELLEIFYKSILLREPDADGIKHHINDLTSIEKIEAKLYEFLYCD